MMSESDIEEEEEILEDIQEPEYEEGSDSLFGSSVDFPLIPLHQELVAASRKSLSLESRNSGDKNIVPDGEDFLPSFATDGNPEVIRDGDASQISVQETNVLPAGELPQSDNKISVSGALQEQNLPQIIKSDEPLEERERSAHSPHPVVTSSSTSPVQSCHSDSSIISHPIHSDPHNDRSLSELSISIPKLSVISLESEQRVSSLVQHFRHREISHELSSPPVDSPRNPWHSLPPHPGGETSPSSRKRPHSQIMKDGSLSKSRVNVANLVSRFSFEENQSLPIKEGKAEANHENLFFPSKERDSLVYKESPPPQNVCDAFDGSEEVPSPSPLGCKTNYSSEGNCTPNLKLCSSLDDIEKSLLNKETDVAESNTKLSLPDRSAVMEEHKIDLEISVLKGNDSNHQSPSKELCSSSHDLDFLCNIAFPDSASLLQESSPCSDKVDINEITDFQKLSPRSCTPKNYVDVERDASSESREDDRLDSPLGSTNTSDELLEIDIGESDQEMFYGDLSDASEIILGFISKSPISAITERTEESGQDIDNKKSTSEDGSLASKVGENDLLDEKKVSSFAAPKDKTKGSENKGSGTLGYFPSGPPSMENDIISSQFTGMSSMAEEGSLVQTQPCSLGTASETVPPPSSQSNQFNPLRAKVMSKKTKLTSKLTSNLKSSIRNIDRCGTPPLSLHGQGSILQGPVMKSGLHRSTSKSMHNLEGGSGGKARMHPLQNRSFSVSTDHLERGNSPRAKSLSPGPHGGYELRTTHLSGSRPIHGANNIGNLPRRCQSAVALNQNFETPSHNIRRNHSVSLNRLNRSRSSSMTSVCSWKRMGDYSHVESKVKQYIRDMKDKDMRNSTRSLPTTPAKKKRDKEEQQERGLHRKAVIEELLFRDLSYLKEEEVPEAILKLRNQIRTKLKGKDESELKVIDQLLQLWSMERKLRYASDTTLAALQDHYNDLNTLYAEKQNEIDRLRFFKDIHVYKEVINLPLNGDKRIVNRRLHSSCSSTPPYSPYNKVMPAAAALFYQQQKSQTSPNTPTRRLSLHLTPPNTPTSLSLSSSLGANNFPTSTPLGEVGLNTTSKPSAKLNGSEEASRVKVLQEEKSSLANSGQVTLDSWVKEANAVLKRVKEFTLLEGSSALQQSERSFIWDSILSQYWRLSSQFPVLSLLPGSSKESGVLVQNLGEAISVTASRFKLELTPSKADVASSQKGDEIQMGETLQDSSKDVQKILVSKSAPNKIHNEELKTFNSSGDKKSQHMESTKVKKFLQFDHENSHDSATGRREKCKNQNGKVRGDRMRKMDQCQSFFGESTGEGMTSQRKNLETDDNLKHNLDAFGPCQPLDHGNENQVKGTKLTVDVMPTPETNFREDDDPMGMDHLEVDPMTAGVKKSATTIISSPSFSPSHESMKTVGPLEKVTMWQESLIGSIAPPHGSYQSSSSLSPAPSSLSLGSSQPFEATANDVDEDIAGDYSLKDFNEFNHLDIGAGVIPLERKTIEEPESITNISLNKNDGSPSAQNTNAITPRLPLGRMVKARDLDSGCPGSERSTKVSQNVSLDIAEQNLDVSDVQPEISDVNFASNSRGEVVTQSSLLKSTNDQQHPLKVRYSSKENADTEEKEQASVVSYSVKDDRSSSRKLCPTHHVDNIKGASHSGKKQRMSKGNLKNDVDNVSSDSSNRSTTDCIKRGHTSDYRKRDKVCQDLSLKIQSSSSRQAAHPDMNVTRKVTSSPRKKSKGLKLSKYDAKYASSGTLSSSSSERLGNSKGSSSVEIHNNISRLKRDLNILKSQMMNLSSEVYEGKNKSSVSLKSKRSKKIASTPVKANVQVSSPCILSSCSDTALQQHPRHCSVSGSDFVEQNFPSTSHKQVSDNDIVICPHELHTCNDVMNIHTAQKKVNVRSGHDPACKQSLAEEFEICLCHKESMLRNKTSNLQEYPLRKSSKAKKKSTSHLLSSLKDTKSCKAENCQRKCFSSDDAENYGIVRLHGDSRRLCSPLAERANECIVAGAGSVPEVILVSEQARASNEEFLHIPVSPHKSVRKRCHSPTPLIFIQNYSCGGTSEKEDHAATGACHAETPNCDKKKRGNSSKSSANKNCRRTESSHTLMASLDKATTLAERLRLRSESMLTYLNFNVSSSTHQ